MSFKPVIFGCAGLGGFAGGICDRLLAHNQIANAPVRLAAVCDPEPQRYPQRVAALRAAGVKVFQSFTELLNEPIEAVWLPLPIDLHRSFTEQALEAGKAVMCEKPAAGCVDDVDAMIAARDRSGLHVAIGFQDVYQPELIALKRRLLSGELGKPTSVTLVACWPRGDRYYRRTGWAGAIQRNGVWILDSPANNAIAHYIHLVMYLLGPQMDQASEPLHVQAELYRAHPIENYDTCSMRIRLSAGVDFVLALTHACDRQLDAQIDIVTDKGSIRVQASKSYQIRLGDSLQTVHLDGSRYRSVIGTFAARLRGDTDAPVGATLEMARAHTVAVNGASQAAAITQVPADWIVPSSAGDWGTVQAIRGIVPILQQCVQRRQMLHESGLVPWSTPPQGIDLHNYRHFPGPKKN